MYNNDNLGIFKTGKDKGEKMKAFLILEDGHVFTGRSIGSTREAVSEIVFNTSMTGYLEAVSYTHLDEKPGDCNFTFDPADDLDSYDKEKTGSNG